MVELNFRKMGEGDPLFILHGLFGSSDNWYTLGKKFSEHFEVYLIDLRNHGKSPHTTNHDYDSMADDILGLIYDEQLTLVNFIGHSMGGKVVMRFAEKHPSLINKMIIGDIGPKEYQPHHDHVIEALEAFNKSGINNRKEALDLIEPIVNDKGVAQFLQKNLYWKEPGKLEWKMNSPVLIESMDKVLAKVPESEVEVETLFLRGAKSNYIKNEDFDMIKKLFPNSEIKTIEGAGHWLHAEEPQQFYDECLFFFDK